MVQAILVFVVGFGALAWGLADFGFSTGVVLGSLLAVALLTALFAWLGGRS